MNLPYSRAPHASGTPGSQPEAPNAALLIDFDNVTMGMRSDLSKELKNLLNSDIIKGKVTVQRAYADWRRYPQYIVPLSENSVDLIFAPAYGSSKKNATDIRMAIDGMELVFIRPEIGTFILLTGDSDFSSLVLKLKEYGKYVIGVGIQESSSDILVQNCDEYYSYTSLSGLKKTTDSANKPLDPWVLVEEAVKKMDARNDVMRSDRLKQVMMEIDPSFDEGNFGFSKFSKFLSEASSRSLVTLRKLENGQYEVQPSQGQEAESGKGRAGPGKKGDTRGRGRGERGGQVGPQTAEKKEGHSGPQDREGSPLKGREGALPSREKVGEDPLKAAYDLLRRAMEEILEGSDKGPVRDSDLKRKMLELEPSFDEGELGFGKFSRFLRQAHDHEVIDLQKREEGTYQVTLRGEGERREEPQEPFGPAHPVPPSEGEPSGDGGRSEGWGLGVRLGERGKSRQKEGPPPILEGQVIHPGSRSSAGPKTGGRAMDLFSEEGVREKVEVGKLGLPSGRSAVLRYLTNSYKGVGKKTAESLVEEFGGELFSVLQNEPDRILAVVPGKRAAQLLEAWKADYQRRKERVLRKSDGGSGDEGSATDGQEAASGQGSSVHSEGPAAQGDDPATAGSGEKKTPPKRRTRRGGRSRRQ